MKILWTAAFMLASQIVVAADYPVRPIRMIVANAPGSTSDIFGRMVFTRLTERLGQQIVVDNRAGAGGMIGADVTSRAAPDGYTLGMFTAAVLTIVPHVQPKLPYHPFDSFTPVSLIVKAQTALCVHPAVPAKTVRDFIDLAKGRQMALNMASAGVGSTSHLGGLMFATMAGFEARHVPYKGGGPGMASVAQGESQWILGPLGAAMPHYRAGRFRCLATGGEARSVAAPELPTMADSGVPGFLYTGWNGVVAPARLPAAILNRINTNLKQVLEDGELRKQFVVQGEEPFYTPVNTFANLIRTDHEAMGKMARLAGVGSR